MQTNYDVGLFIFFKYQTDEQKIGMFILSFDFIHFSFSFICTGTDVEAK